MRTIHKLCWLGLVSLGFSSCLRAESPLPDYRKAIRIIARDIEALRRQYPQLREFSRAKDIDTDRLIIEYGYHTHAGTHSGGWTSQVPNPDDDGIWLYVDLHEPDSISQIDTQPAQPLVQNCVGKKRVTFLVLEGRATRAVAGEIWAILKRNGAVPCP